MSAPLVPVVKPRLTFLYNGEFVDSDLQTKSVRESEDGRLYETFTIGGTLEVTTESVRHGDAIEWVSWFEYKGISDKSGQVTQLCDCNINVPFEPDFYPDSLARIQEGRTTLVYAHNGSDWNEYDFSCDVESYGDRVLRKAALSQLPRYRAGNTNVKHFAPIGGRSSHGAFPFYNINQGDYGVIFAIGWTGQWNCDLERALDGTINIRTGLEDVDWHLLPGERIRTSSIIVMPYSSGYEKGQQAFRRLLRDYYSLIGKPGRPERAPLCMSFWGGLTSDGLVERIDKIGAERLGYEFAWVDAGWYGQFTEPSPNEFEGNWWAYTGDWSVNRHFHPDNLEDVSAACKRNKLGFLLWLEIERVNTKLPVVKAHPEYLIGDMIDLGNEAAWAWAYKTIANLIRRLNISCYRQDFNITPLGRWRDADAVDGRKGMHEIKYIMGLYRLWDSLLAEFPHLIIDNCASGGRRIDIETLRRSLPLWRDDYQCPANHDVDAAQNHNIAISRWLPYHGTSSGRIVGDTYRARSCYAPAFASSPLFSSTENPENLSDDDCAWIRRINNEFKKVRELMQGDYRPLVEMSPTVDRSTWSAYQYSLKDEGFVMAFRRAKSPFCEARFELCGIDPLKSYLFEDSDTGQTFTISGKELSEKGISVVIDQPRSSKLYFYKAIRG